MYSFDSIISFVSIIHLWNGVLKFVWLEIASSTCSIDITNTCEWSELPTIFLYIFFYYNMEQAIV